jgi:ribonuclease HI
MSRKRALVVSTDENAINVFTDGSSLSNPRRGGIGYRFVTINHDGDEVCIDSDEPGYEQGTNQQMELMACIVALRELSGRHSHLNVNAYFKVIVHTDSAYVAENVDRARSTWPREKWMTRDGNPIENADLWKDLVKAESGVGTRVDFKWGKGHSRSTNPHNDAVDKLAKASARGPLLPPLSVAAVRRKTVANKTERYSIRAEGQRITLRIVTARWLSVQRCHLYKCEAVSPDSKFFGNVDNISSDDIDLRAGHTYEVLLNDEPRRPRIVANYGEVAPV